MLCVLAGVDSVKSLAVLCTEGAPGQRGEVDVLVPGVHRSISHHCRHRGQEKQCRSVSSSHTSQSFPPGLIMVSSGSSPCARPSLTLIHSVNHVSGLLLHGFGRSAGFGLVWHAALDDARRRSVRRAKMPRKRRKLGKESGWKSALLPVPAYKAAAVIGQGQPRVKVGEG